MKRCEINKLRDELEESIANFRKFNRVANNLDRHVEKLEKYKFKDFGDYLDTQYKLDHYYYLLGKVRNRLWQEKENLERLDKLLDKCNEELYVLCDY